MRRFLYILLSVCIASSGFAQDRVKGNRSEAVGYSTRDATIMSMMGWGVILAVISAGVSVIFKESPESSSSSGGGTSH